MQSSRRQPVELAQNYYIYSSLFSSPLNFVAVLFDKNKLQTTVQVSFLFYFVILSRFFKGKLKSGFCCFFKWAFFSLASGRFREFLQKKTPKCM